MRNQFVVSDPNKCIGCRTCEIACAVAHSKNNIFTTEPSDIQFVSRLNVVKTAKLSAAVQCRQCEDPSCVKACAAGAIYKKDGQIWIDEKKCIGCKTCSMACPCGAIDLVVQYNAGGNPEECYKGKDELVASKCDLCAGRPGGPACVEVCPTSALEVLKHICYCNHYSPSCKEDCTPSK